MKSKAPNRNQFWANLMVEELVRCGITTFFVAPGSRSTPLVVAVHNHPMCSLVMHFDERGTAFMALGYGKGKGMPACWITTSGTALANGFPAIVEADLERTPMLLLTADRPPELRDTDANQTIRQDHIFGNTVRWFVDVPPPSDEIDPAYVLTTIDHAVHRSCTGPVHVNCMFREPLAPDNEPYTILESARFLDWMGSKRPFSLYCSPLPTCESFIHEAHRVLLEAKRPMFILGRMQGDPHEIQQAVWVLCKAYHAVCAIDMSSQARLGWPDDLQTVAFCGMDVILSKNSPIAIAPDCVFQLGATAVSKRLSLHLKELQPPFWVIDDRERRIDPHHQVTHRLQADPRRVLLDWAEYCFSEIGETALSPQSTANKNGWGELCSDLNQARSKWLEQDVAKNGLTEQFTAYAVSDHLDNQSVLCVASSNSVRHMDAYAGVKGVAVPVLTNRGASGIDGTVASALGFGRANNKRPVVVLGDLALLHDLNSLAACRAVNAIIVVVNNNGGGIFSHLPISNHITIFEPLFGTPHGVGFGSAAEMFGLLYRLPTSESELEAALTDAFAEPEAILIEVRTDREDNIAEHHRLYESFLRRVSCVSGAE